MSNWIGTARTNRVHIIDADALETSLQDYEIRIDFNKDRTIAVFLADTEYGDWPTYANSGDESEFSFESHVMPYVEEGCVLITQAAGAEKARYITGSAWAYIRKGDEVESIGIDLDDIYRVAAASFNVKQNEITLAEY